MSGKLVEGLAQKLRASPTPVHPALFAALLGDRRNAKQLLGLLGGLKTMPIRAKGRHQARGQDRARSRKTVKQGAIGMLAKKHGNLAVKALVLRAASLPRWQDFPDRRYADSQNG